MSYEVSKVWTTPDFRNAPATRNLGGEEIMDAPGNDGNASMREQVKRPNPWRKMMMMMMMMKMMMMMMKSVVLTEDGLGSDNASCGTSSPTFRTFR